MGLGLRFGSKPLTFGIIGLVFDLDLDLDFDFDLDFGP
jgi:hypothetical protein